MEEEDGQRESKMERKMPNLVQPINVDQIDNSALDTIVTNIPLQI